MARASNVTLLVVLTAVLGSMKMTVEAADHIVGDSTGWLSPPSPNFYSIWASDQTFAVGDTLTFNFATGVHDVAIVSKSDYDNCNTTANNVQASGPTTITLSSAGEQYYFCTFSDHCSRGQKLAITVGGNSSSTPTTSPPNAASITTVFSAFGLMFMSMVIALLLS
ncbi:hypothetical protein K2173_020984 [Erythroxylum novogranatense]|uniref:Phytocyanin domain-containing protein n=1 Tax=Erythroxylum novogranatense TaxID=1862640 RepID=A0AAV8TQ56_9ROSI|nr:hypothetical protein K2173_020984 [Erythroxylum novogranatense]